MESILWYDIFEKKPQWPLKYQHIKTLCNVLVMSIVITTPIIITIIAGISPHVTTKKLDHK